MPKQKMGNLGRTLVFFLIIIPTLLFVALLDIGAAFLGIIPGLGDIAKISVDIFQNTVYFIIALGMYIFWGIKR